MLMYELLTGEAPFDGKDESAVFNNIVRQKIRFPRWCSAATISLLKGFLNRDPSGRVGCRSDGAREIKRHPFFLSLSWQKAEALKLTPPIIPAGTEETANFDSDFTSQQPVITPEADSLLDAINQSRFENFEFTRQPKSDKTQAS